MRHGTCQQAHRLLRGAFSLVQLPDERDAARGRVLRAALLVRVELPPLPAARSRESA